MTGLAMSQEERPAYAISVRPMTAESVGAVLLGGAAAILGFVVGTQMSWWIGVPIALGALPLWGWACLANQTFYKE